MSSPPFQRITVTPGRCTNLDYCSIGMQREVIKVPVGQPFICPECARPLRPPKPAGWQRPIVLPALRIAILCLGIALGGVFGYRLGRLAPVNAAPARQPTASTAVLPPVQTAPEPAPGANAAPLLHPAVHLHPFPARLPVLAAVDPPQHLEGEQRFGQVILDCIFTASRATASCRTGDVRGSDAFSLSAIPWLQTLSPLYWPDGRGGPDHRWRVIFQDYVGVAPVK